MNTNIEQHLTTTVLDIIGFGVLTLSWILPVFVKDKANKHILGMLLAAFSLGFFVSAIVVRCMN